MSRRLFLPMHANLEPAQVGMPLRGIRATRGSKLHAQSAQRMSRRDIPTSACSVASRFVVQGQRRVVLMFVILFAAIALLIQSPAFAAEPQGFDLGRTDYESGKYDDAAKAFQSHAEKEVSAGLLHNLGNAEFKLGHLGPAILAWERARALDPGSRNTKANLHFARGHAGLEQPESPWYETYSAFFPPNRWITIATVAFWVSVALLVLPPLLHRRRTALSQAAAVVAIILFLLTLPALAGILTRGRIGIVQVADTSLRLTPTQEGEVLGTLPEGETARVEKVRGGYRYIRASSDRAGWVRGDEFTLLWP